MSFAVKPKNKPPVDPNALQAFAAGADATPGSAQAEQGSAATPQPPAVPNWAAFDNKRRRPAFSMRFTDLESAQLKHLAETTPLSAHEYCLRAVQQALAKDFPETK